MTRVVCGDCQEEGRDGGCHACGLVRVHVPAATDGKLNGTQMFMAVPDTALKQGDKGRCQAADREAITEVGYGELEFAVKAPGRPWLSDEKTDPWVWIYRVGHNKTWRLRRSVFNCNPMYFESHFLFDKE